MITLTDKQYHDGSSVAQAMVMLYDKGMYVDGKWGTFSQSRYDRLNPEQQLVVRSALSGVLPGVTVKDLFEIRQSAKALALRTSIQPATGASMSRDDVIKMIRRVSMETGVSEGILVPMAVIESNLNPLVKDNGSSVGLFQLQPAAWTDAMAIDKTLPTYAVGVRNPYLNARAAAAYVKVNLRTLSRLGYNGPITPEVVYFAHQQGAGGFIELWKRVEGIPPKGRTLVSADAMLGNPPQDGKGKTKDPVEFYKRWMAVLKAKFAVAY